MTIRGAASCSDKTYNQAGQLTSLTDAANNTTVFTYDLAGRRTGLADPDQGTSSTSYDRNSNPTSTTLNGDTLVTNYDVLNRPIERRQNSISGPLLANWTYDVNPADPGAGQANGWKGRLSTATAAVTSAPTLSGNYTRSYTYDNRGRAATGTLSVPTATGFAGPYTATYTYNSSDLPVNLTYAAAGSLGGETVTNTYNTYGVPNALTSPLANYVSATNYDPTGRVSSRTFGAGAVSRQYTYDALNRLSTLSATTNTGIVAQNLTIGYDAADNVIQTTDAATAERACYNYDEVNRMTRAWTADAATRWLVSFSGPDSRSVAGSKRMGV